MSASHLARLLGMKRSDQNRVEATTVLRTLGISPRCGRKDRGHIAQRVHRKTALRYAEALNLDPVEWGIHFDGPILL
jgi:hypothetical protein